MCAAESLTWAVAFTACGTKNLLRSAAVLYLFTNKMFIEDLHKILSAFSQLKGDCLFVCLTTFTQLQGVQQEDECR